MIYSKKNGRVAGVIADEDEIEADVVIAADGVNSLLAQKAGLKQELQPDQVAVGIKEIIELPETVINDRFNVTDREGATRLFVGECTRNLRGGGFLYTNRKSISLGLVFNLDGVTGSAQTLPEIMEAFKHHPRIEPLIEGGKTVEYAAHLVPEAGIRMLPRLSADGILVVGDAAGLVINVGYTVRGMDLAAASGRIAAETVIEAKNKGDFSLASLARYEKALRESFVMKDLETFKNAPAFLHTQGLYQDYPQAVEAVMRDIFTMDGAPARPVMKKALPHLRRLGLLRIIKDAWKGRTL